MVVVNIKILVVRFCFLLHFYCFFLPPPVGTCFVGEVSVAKLLEGSVFERVKTEDEVEEVIVVVWVVVAAVVGVAAAELLLRAIAGGEIDVESLSLISLLLLSLSTPLDTALSDSPPSPSTSDVPNNDAVVV